MPRKQIRSSKSSRSQKNAESIKHGRVRFQRQGSPPILIHCTLTCRPHHHPSDTRGWLKATFRQSTLNAILAWCHGCIPYPWSGFRLDGEKRLYMHQCMFSTSLDIGVDGYGTSQTDKKGYATGSTVVTCSSCWSWCSYKEEKISLGSEVEIY